MLHTHLFKKTLLLLLVSVGIFYSCSKKELNVQNPSNNGGSPTYERFSVTLTNSGFESDTLGWGSAFSISTSSPRAYAGTKQARLTSASRKVEQTVSVSPQTFYVISAWVTGNGIIGVRNGTDTLRKKTSIGSPADTIWRQVIDTFSTNSYSSVIIFGRYGTAESRLDNFALDVLTPSNPSSLTLIANSTSSITLKWTDNSNDESKFKIERKVGTGSWLVIDSVNANITTYTSVSLSENTKYSYRVRASITGGNHSGYTNIDSLTTGRTVSCSTATQLSNALSNAQPGDKIVLSNGTFSGLFKAYNRSGLPNNPITLVGSRNAILDGNSISTGYGLELDTANYWILKGFTIRNSLKGLMLDTSSNCVIDSLLVTNTGEEGIHLRKNSKNNTVKRCEVNNTGRLAGREGYGEGIYIGTAVNNWVNYTNGNPDNCDNNIVEYNIIGPNVTAECIDVKEGTTGGIYRNNTFNSDGISGLNGGDCWMDLKGNNNLIENNTGNNPSTETDFVEGYGVHVKVSGWGNNNTFKGNVCNVNRAIYGIKVSNSNGGLPNPSGTVVCTSNTVSGSGSTLTNITTTSCP